MSSSSHHMCYVTDACDCAQSIILLPHMVRMSRFWYKLFFMTVTTFGCKKIGAQKIKKIFFPRYVLFFKALCTLVQFSYTYSNLKSCYIVCTPHFQLGEGGWTSYQIFKKGGLDRTLIFRERLMGKKEGVTFSRGSQFLHKR